MLLTSSTLERIIDAMLVDPLFLNSPGSDPSDIGLVPIVAPFAPSVNLVVSDLTYPALGVFDQRTIMCGSVVQRRIVNTAGEQGIQLQEPVGGFTWTTADLAAGPVTVYGFAVTRIVNSAAVALFATGMLITPVTLTLLLQTIQASSILGFFGVETMGVTTDVLPQP